MKPEDFQVFFQKNLFFQDLSCKTQGLAYLECGLSVRLYTNQRSQVWSISIQNYYPCTIEQTSLGVEASKLLKSGLLHILDPIV